MNNQGPRGPRSDMACLNCSAPEALVTGIIFNKLEGSPLAKLLSDKLIFSNWATGPGVWKKLRCCVSRLLLGAVIDRMLPTLRCWASNR